MRKTLAFLVGSSLVALILTGCGTTKSAPINSKPAVGQGIAARGGGSYLNQPIPSNVLNLSLFDAQGKKFTLASLKGQSVVITNFLTSCQEICPMTSANMRDIGDAVMKAGASSKIKVVEVSVDAERDIPTRLAAYQALYQDTNWTLASGSSADLKTFWTYFGAPANRSMFSKAESAKMPMDWQTGKPVTYDMSHADLVLIVDDQLNWRWLDLGAPNIGNATIPAKLKSFLSADGLNNLAKPEEPTWTTTAVFSALTDITGVKF